MLKKHILDILVPLSAYPHVRDTASLHDAFALLDNAYAKGKRYRHILVLNDKEQLVGLLGLRDILRGVFPDYLSTGKLRHFEGVQPDFPSLTLIWQETFATQCKEAAKRPIKDFMGAVPDSVKPNDPITLAAYLMVMRDRSMLPVVDDGRVVGVVRVIDVFHQTSKAVLHD